MILFALICGTLWLIWYVYAAFAYRPRRLAGATVLVTGACSEVGRRLCLHLYARGARVIAWDYSRVKLLELQAEVLRIAGGGPLNGAPSAGKAGAEDDFVVTAVDVTSRMQVQRACKEIDGAVDILINAAHNFPSKGLSERTDDSVDRVVQTNLVAPLLVIRQLLPLLLQSSKPGTAARRREDYAQIVNIVDAAANFTVTPEAPDYAASQWGVVGMHYSLRAWLAHERVAYANGSFSCGGDLPNDKESAGGGRPRGSTRASSQPTIAAATAANTHPTRPTRPAREVRTTLLCLNDIQLGIPTALSSQLAPLSPMIENAVLASPGNTSTLSGGIPERTASSTVANSSSSGVSPRPAARATSASSTSREGYVQALQRRNAELDRVVTGCVSAIGRGQERYCHTAAASWRTTAVYPLVLLSPVPWAERLLRWLQRPASTGTTTAEA